MKGGAMSGVALSLVTTTLLAMVILITGVLLESTRVTTAGLFALLLTPIVRNVAFVIVEKRAIPRALAVGVGIALLAIYGWMLG